MVINNNSKKKPKNYGECVYCGREAQLTSDHIPPKNLFPKPRPSNLITVPSCKRCNRSASKDDEYLRLVLVMREDVFSRSERCLVEKFWDIMRELTP